MSGSVGIAAVQITRAHDLMVIGTAGSERGLQLVAEQGVQHVLNYHTPDYLDKVKDLTGGRGVDVVLEMEASANLANDLKVLAPYGRVVIIGSRAEASFDPIDAILLDANILGMTLYKVPDDDMKAIQAYLKLGLKAGDLRPIVGEEIPLAEAPRAHEALMRSNSYGKIVLIP